MSCSLGKVRSHLGADCRREVRRKINEFTAQDELSDALSFDANNLKGELRNFNLIEEKFSIQK